MSTAENNLSTSKLASSREYREAFVAAFLKRYIPFQIRTIRKKKNMSQQELAVASKVTQGVISRAEDPDYGNLTFNTVLRIAAGFDLAFVGEFVRFSELLQTIDEMSENSLDLPDFAQECTLEAASAKENSAFQESAQVEGLEGMPCVEDLPRTSAVVETERAYHTIRRMLNETTYQRKPPLGSMVPPQQRHLA